MINAPQLASKIVAPSYPDCWAIPIEVQLGITTSETFSIFRTLLKNVPDYECTN
jgi:hypothetical protein